MVKEIARSRAIILRKQKYSYRQIAEQLSVSKATVSRWLGDLAWSNKMIDVLSERAKAKSRENLKKMAETHRAQRAERRIKNIKLATAEFKKLVDNRLFLIGLGIYWGEGDKNDKNGLIRISNIDADMIRWFILFLDKICAVPRQKIKLWILLYPDLKEQVCKRYWVKNCHIPEAQFVKRQIIQGRHVKKRLSYGVCNLYVCDRLLKDKILTWIKLLGRM